MHYFPSKCNGQFCNFVKNRYIGDEKQYVTGRYNGGIISRLYENCLTKHTISWERMWFCNNSVKNCYEIKITDQLSLKRH